MIHEVNIINELILRIINFEPFFVLLILLISLKRTNRKLSQISKNKTEMRNQYFI